MTGWPEEIEWQNIIDNFRAQAMLPLVGGVLCSLNGKYKISEQQEEMILQVTSNTVQVNFNVQEVTERIFSALKENGCDPLLLKGLSLARLYPNPNLRACGDIDILVRPEQYLRAIKTLQEICDDTGTEDFMGRHYKFHYEDLIVELHQRPGFCANLWYEKRYRELSKRYYQESVAAGGRDELIPQFNVWYVFNHLLHHFHDGGVGLRQFVDWMLVLKDVAENGGVDEVRLLADLKSTGLLRPWRIFGHLLVDYLGLPADDFPFYRDDDRERGVLERYLPEIVRRGNFGHLLDARTKPANVLARKVSTLVGTVSMAMKLWPLMPTGAIGYCWGNVKMAMRAVGR